MYHLKGLGGGEEIDRWPFHEYEYHTAKLIEVLEKEKNAREGKNESSSTSIKDPRLGANQMMQQAQRNIKMPTGLKFPK